MSSLASTTEKMRSLIKIGVIIGGAIFMLYLFIMGGVFVKNLFFPTAPEGPKQEFGELPQIVFEQIPDSTINYQINTVTGELPTNLPTRMFVYKLEQPKPDLLALQNARSITSSAGYNQGELKISDSIYQWSNSSTNSSLQYDINEQTFRINTNILSNQNIINNAVIPDEIRIQQNLNDLLNTMRVEFSGLAYSEQSIKYLDANLNPVDNPINAKVVDVSLYNNTIENDLGTFNFVYPNPPKSLVNFIVAFPSSHRLILLEGNSHNKVLTEEFSDYPIKSVTDAFEELKNGSGYLYNPTQLRNIQITNVFVAYYLDENTKEYAQPVYVFEGVNATAYVPAAIYTIQSVESTSE